MLTVRTEQKEEGFVKKYASVIVGIVLIVAMGGIFSIMTVMNNKVGELTALIEPEYED